MTSNKSFDDVMEAYKEKHKLTEFHVTLGEEATPEALWTELERIDALFAVRAMIDDLTLLEAKVERYEKLITEIGRLGTTNVRDFLNRTQSDEVSELKRKIFDLTEFAQTENLMDDIEFAKRKGVIN